MTFNLSHAHGNAMIAIAQGREVGVDLEMIREDVEALKLAERFFSDREQLHVRSTAPESRSREFFHYWVAKEAVMKAEGVGLASLQACEIDWSSGSDRDGVPVRLAGRSQVPWVVRTLDCGPGWVGAVAAQGSNWTINPCRIGLIAGNVRAAGTDVLGSLAASLREKLSQQGLAFSFTQASGHSHPVIQSWIGRNIHQ